MAPNPFTRHVDQVMTTEPWASSRSVYRVVDKHTAAKTLVWFSLRAPPVIVLRRSVVRLDLYCRRADERQVGCALMLGDRGRQGPT